MKTATKIGAAVALFVLLCAGPARAEATSDAGLWLQSMAKAQTEGPLRFRYAMESAIGGQPGSVKMEGHVTQNGPKRIRAEMTMTMVMGDSKVETKSLQVVDGEKIWIEMRNPMMGGTQVMRMSIDQAGKMAGGGMPMGAGSDPLQQIEQMSKMFDLKVTEETQQTVTLRAEATKDTLAEMEKAGAAPEALQSLGSYVLVVDKATGFPREARFGGDPPAMVVRFSDFERLAEVDPATFRYTPPEGVTVIDMEAMASDEPEK